ncbi:PREDICTED: probable histone-lysine N-methyltransferase set-23 isoform X3 [Drosophila arizonae]|uniref:Probable histone-lysine N-methyltransferase set-23 isoform X3 n=1 Tax=Drosophila arizonae TaxID=7263 RepID=A0ABM1NLW7_DROAR|nr:PREDICTED: probable histone-lysine N-methyltransferase set-23 isoform X3 [Drosophila arizonae]
MKSMPTLIEIEDNYDHMENVEYILENVLMPDDGSLEFRHLQDDYNSQLTLSYPSKRGNIGRYLNHSCQPNCKILPVRTNCPIPKIGIFAKRDILANEELCFHYAGGDSYNGMLNGKPCLCGSTYCNGFIPNTQI